MSDLKFNDERMQLSMSKLLRAGVVLSALVVSVGGIIYLFRHGMEIPDYRTFSGEPTGFTKPKAIFTHIFQLHGRGFIMLGILILIATPIARIIFAVIGFTMEKDRLYVLISLVVLGIILTSLFSGVAG